MIQKRLSRASFLKITGLPEAGQFELRPDRHPQDGRPMIRVRVEGHSDVLHSPWQMKSYADQIRETAPELAAQIDTCLDELKLSTQN